MDKSCNAMETLETHKKKHRQTPKEMARPSKNSGKKLVKASPELAFIEINGRCLCLSVEVCMVNEKSLSVLYFVFLRLKLMYARKNL